MSKEAVRLPFVALLAAHLLACGGPPPPSIVLVTLDTVRRDHVGAYADASAPPSARGLTPHLDALAATGLVHDAAYTTMPTTGPAHVSLFTGLLPSQHGATRNGEPLADAHAPRELARRLRDRGYATAAFVTSRIAGPQATGLHGFEVYDVPEGVLRSGREAAEGALAWLAVEKRRPVFLWLHVYDAHAPFGTRAEKGRSFPLPPRAYGWVDPARYETPEARREMAERYARGVHDADAALGLLLEGVRRELERPPLVAVASDHGESLDEHLAARGYAYDHGEFLDSETVRIALVLAGPGVTPGRSAATASIRELYTTLLAAAGIADADADAEGRRDLREPSEARRIVGIERRSFRAPPPELVLRHAGAAALGGRLVVVAADGSPTLADASPPPDLLRVARSRAAARRKAATAELSPELRETLQSLGYAE